MKKILLILLCISILLIQQSFAQNQNVTGIVTAKEDGLPLPGVSVKIKGTNFGAQTDQAGKYTLNVQAGAILVFSFIAYTTQEVPVNGKTTLNVVLVQNSKQLNEVVISGALGISQRVKALGYSESTVKPDQVLQKSEPDLLKNLEGKVAGVDIRTSNGTPGAATRITIRGNSSFFGDNQPLIVVDGVPYSNDQVNTTANQVNGGGAYGSGIANLDPNDIAGITVLKGASGAALYGSRASNGAVLITTKSGSASRSKKGFEITFRSSASIEQVANLPDYQNLYGAGTQSNYSNSNGSWGPAFTSLSTIPVWPDYKAAYPDMFPGSTVPYVAYPNNVKDLFKNGSVFENSITFNGGDEKNSVSSTASQLNQNGYLINSDYKRSAFALGGSSKFNDGVNVHANMSYTRSVQTGGFYGDNQIGGVPSEFARTLFLARNWDLNLPYEDQNGISLTPNGGSQFDNPRWSAIHNTITTDEERVIANFRADKDLGKWANLSFALGTNVNRLDRRELIDIGSRAAAGLGSLTVDAVRDQEIESNTLLTFKPKLPSNFTMKPVIGFEYNQRTNTRNQQVGNQFVTSGIYELTNTSQQIFVIDSYSRRRLMGLFANVDLGYKDWAFVTLTARNDWSSTLPENARSFFYYSANGSLVFTDALKMQSDIMDFGKIRVGYSKVGHDADPYATNNVFVIGSNFLGQSTGYFNTSASSPNLAPEFSKEFEIGTQLSFWNGRIGLDFTFYNKNSTSQLASLPTPPSTGFTSLYTNFGSINNKGEEISLNITAIKSNSFSWNIAGTFTHNKNIVTSLTEGVTRIGLTVAGNGVETDIGPYLEPGLPYGYLRGTKDLRDANGNLLIDPTSGLLIRDPNQGYLGDPNPTAILGLGNTFNYKGVSLHIGMDATIGGSFYSTTINQELGRGVTLDTQDRLSGWVIPGVYGDANTGKPVLDANGKEIKNTSRVSTNDLYFGESFGSNAASEYSIFDATVYRLREITVGYTFPKSLYSKVPIGSINLSISGHNLWYYAPHVPKHTNFDPETNSFGNSNIQGLEFNSSPSVRRYGINLSVTF
ncbi:MAG TPA: SusC/RagA family TonB-linked outer membrane protein [Mucilaginibacter sp.]